jgi:VWFA-related protein
MTGRGDVCRAGGQGRRGTRTTMKAPIAAALAIPLALCAQSTPVLRVDVDLVTIPCAVVDEQGIAVRGLTREDFRVYDNGIERRIEHLWLDADLPLTIGVIVDVSESQRDQVTEHLSTVMEFLEQTLRPGDRAFVVSVGEDVRLWSDLTGSVHTLRRRISAETGELLGEPCPKQRLHGPGLRPVSQCGGTPLWNAIYYAARMKLQPPTGSAALLILTDGFDTGSTHSLNEALDEVHKAGAAAYAIRYQSGFGGRSAPGLSRLAAASGGQVFQPPKGGLDAILSRVQSDLRSRYVLGFRPERLSFGKVRHQVRVEMTRPELHVRARNTYFQTSP